jgi:hypothetical protein
MLESFNIVSEDKRKIIRDEKRKWDIFLGRAQRNNLRRRSARVGGYVPGRMREIVHLSRMIIFVSAVVSVPSASISITVTRPASFAGGCATVAIPAPALLIVLSD